LALTIEEVIVTAGINAGAVVGAMLYIHDSSRRPVVGAKVTKKEDHFEARIVVTNYSKTAYTYRIKVGAAYLDWVAKEEPSGDKTRIILTEDCTSPVILDSVVDDLEYNEIEIECHGWRPWPVTIFKKLYDEI